MNQFGKEPVASRPHTTPFLRAILDGLETHLVSDEERTSLRETRALCERLEAATAPLNRIATLHARRREEAECRANPTLEKFAALGKESLEQLHERNAEIISRHKLAIVTAKNAATVKAREIPGRFGEVVRERVQGAKESDRELMEYYSLPYAPSPWLLELEALLAFCDDESTRTDPFRWMALTIIEQLL